MKNGVILGIFLVLVFSFPAAAEFYRYKDAHGNTIYTDDYSKVPSDQRDNAKSYEETISKPQTESVEDPPEDLAGEDEKERRLLEERQKSLTQEYDGLTAERDALDEAQKAAVTRTQVKDYNKKVVEFNARIKAYEEKRNAHTVEVEKFNQRMADKESSSPPQ